MSARSIGPIALAAWIVFAVPASADTMTYKNVPADKDVLLYQSGDRDLRQRVQLCFWFKAESGSFKIASERFRDPIELGGDKPEQRVVCGSIITVRAAAAENALQYAVVK